MKLKLLALKTVFYEEKGRYDVIAYDVEEEKVYKVFKRKKSYRMNSVVKAENSVISMLRKQGHYVDFNLSTWKKIKGVIK